MLDAEQRRRAGTVTALAAPWQERALEPVTTDRRGRYEHALTRWQRASVAAVVSGELAALGYQPAHRRAVAAGAVLNAARAVEDVPGVIHRARLRRNFTPARHYDEVQRFLRRNRTTKDGDGVYM
jgi:hypothetical protein